MHERRSRIAWFIVVFLFVSLIAIPSAYAYIDPGTGSFIFQLIVGGLLAAGVVFRSFWRRVWHLLTRRKLSDKPSSRVD